MYVLSNDFHENLQQRLTRWLVKQPKLMSNTYAGQSDNVIQVTASDGITYNLQFFNEQYLERYYNSEKFEENCEKLTKAMAKVVKDTIIEMNSSDVTIQLTIRLHQRFVCKTYKIEKSTIFISV